MVLLLTGEDGALASVSITGTDHGVGIEDIGILHTIIDITTGRSPITIQEGTQEITVIKPIDPEITIRI